MVGKTEKRKTKYRIPKPRECLSCQGTCYAYRIIVTEREGSRLCFWACNRCDRAFRTFERERDFIEVETLPEDVGVRGVAFEEVEED